MNTLLVVISTRMDLLLLVVAVSGVVLGISYAGIFYLNRMIDRSGR